MNINHCPAARLQHMSLSTSRMHDEDRRMPLTQAEFSCTTDQSEDGIYPPQQRSTFHIKACRSKSMTFQSDLRQERSSSLSALRRRSCGSKSVSFCLDVDDEQSRTSGPDNGHTNMPFCNFSNRHMAVERTGSAKELVSINDRRYERRESYHNPSGVKSLGVLPTIAKTAPSVSNLGRLEGHNRRPTTSQDYQRHHLNGQNHREIGRAFSHGNEISPAKERQARRSSYLRHSSGDRRIVSVKALVEAQKTSVSVAGSAKHRIRKTSLIRNVPNRSHFDSLMDRDARSATHIPPEHQQKYIRHASSNKVDILDVQQQEISSRAVNLIAFENFPDLTSRRRRSVSRKDRKHDNKDSYAKADRGRRKSVIGIIPMSFEEQIKLGQDANSNPNILEDTSNASANSDDAILPNKAQPLHPRGEKLPEQGEAASQTYDGKVFTDQSMLSLTNGSSARKVDTYPVCASLTYQNDFLQPKLLRASPRNPTDAALAAPSHTNVVKRRAIGKIQMELKKIQVSCDNPRTFAEFDEWLEHCRDPQVLSKRSRLHDSRRDPRNPLKRSPSETYSPKEDVRFMQHLKAEAKWIRDDKYPMPGTCKRSPMIRDGTHLKESYAISTNGGGNGLTMRFPQQILMIINLLPGNSRCCDCGCTEGSAQRKQCTWASVAHGTILCGECAFQHMCNGRENEIKSFDTDLDWTFSEIVSMLEGGNAAFLLEMHFKKGTRSDADSTLPLPVLSHGDFNAIYSSRSISQYRKMLRKKVLKVSNGDKALLGFSKQHSIETAVGAEYSGETYPIDSNPTRDIALTEKAPILLLAVRRKLLFTWMSRNPRYYSEKLTLR